MTESFDVIVVGTGAGGGTRAHARADRKSDATAMKGEEPHLTRLAPRWSLDDVARHAVDLWLATEDLPMPGNRANIPIAGVAHQAGTCRPDTSAAAATAERS
jgi:hypothetical protein